MKICHELNQLDFGGVEKVIRNIIKYDDKNEHTVAAYKDGPFRKELEAVGAEIVLLEDDDVDIAADLIHIHSGGAPSSLARDVKGKFPVLETIHSPVRSANTKEVVTERIGVTKAVAELNDNCKSILNGIDFSTTKPDRSEADIKDELHLPVDIPIVGRLGRIGRDKGMEEWMLTCYELQQSGVNFIPLIVGGEARNEKRYVGQLKLMAASLPVRGVVWTGHRDDVANLLQIMDVFLYPSPTEGFGLVFIEAIYNGAIVVTYNTPAIWEVLGGHAIFTNQEDGIIGLKKATEKALFDTHFKDTFLSNQRDFVESEYEAERMSKEYQKIYERYNGHING